MHTDSIPHNIPDLATLAAQIKAWGQEFGFQAVGISDIDLSQAETGLMDWLAAGFHGEMDYMAKHGTKRSRPQELVPCTISIIAARMNYLPPAARDSTEVLADSGKAFISRYALGRDYHKLMRKRLQQLATRIERAIGPFGYRVFCDSAPVMEASIAHKGGLGWRGKHTLLLSREAGSLFFLGEIYVDLPLLPDVAGDAHCGTCAACLPACPTGAIVAPYKVDARRCISYLTIELQGSIPEDLRPLMGNRIYGCDDCQLACPWNRFAQATAENDYHVRNGLDNTELIELFNWNEQEFRDRLAGSAIHRIGHERWLRNIAVALGNATFSPAVITALTTRQDHPSALVREHVAWALAQHCIP